MAIFGNMSITNAGQVLYTKAQAGKPIVFTKMSVGSGQIGTQNPATLTALVQSQFDVAISSITPNTLAKSAAVSGTINNTDMTVATYICEIGLWATDPDVGLILYGYASAGTQGDYMAPASQGAYSWMYQINAAIGNAANVTANISSILYDYSVLNTTGDFITLSGGNQKEINKTMDTALGNVNSVVSAAVAAQSASFTAALNAHTTDYVKHPGYAITTGSANTYVANLSPAPTSYADGMGIVAKINVASTGASTINVNNLGAKNILDSLGNTVTSGGLKASTPYTLRYEATSGNFILQGKGGGGNATADQLHLGATATTDIGPIVGTSVKQYGVGDTISVSQTIEKTAITELYSEVSNSSSYYINIIGEDKTNIYVYYHTGSVYHILIFNKTTRTYVITTTNMGGAQYGFFSKDDGYFYVFDDPRYLRKYNATTGALIWSYSCTYATNTNNTPIYVDDSNNVYVIYGPPYRAVISSGGVKISDASMGISPTYYSSIKNVFNYFANGLNAYAYDMVAGTQISTSTLAKQFAAFDFPNKIGYCFDSSYNLTAYTFSGTLLWTYVTNDYQAESLIAMDNGVYHYKQLGGQQFKVASNGTLFYRNDGPYTTGLSYFKHIFGTDYFTALFNNSNGSSYYNTLAKIRENIQL